MPSLVRLRDSANFLKSRELTKIYSVVRAAHVGQHVSAVMVLPDGRDIIVRLFKVGFPFLQDIFCSWSPQVRDFICGSVPFSIDDREVLDLLLLSPFIQGPAMVQVCRLCRLGLADRLERRMHCGTIYAVLTGPETMAPRLSARFLCQSGCSLRTHHPAKHCCGRCSTSATVANHMASQVGSATKERFDIRVSIWNHVRALLLILDSFAVQAGPRP